jgi:hypothetical protein
VKKISKKSKMAVEKKKPISVVILDFCEFSGELANIGPARFYDICPELFARKIFVRRTFVR